LETADQLRNGALLLLEGIPDGLAATKQAKKFQALLFSRFSKEGHNIVTLFRQGLSNLEHNFILLICYNTVYLGQYIIFPLLGIFQNGIHLTVSRHGL
jgi:hypothetical protein